jgi:hypothetical protein
MSISAICEGRSYLLPLSRCPSVHSLVVTMALCFGVDVAGSIGERAAGKETARFSVFLKAERVSLSFHFLTWRPALARLASNEKTSPEAWIAMDFCSKVP